MGIRDIEDVLTTEDMVVTLEAALVALRTSLTVDKLADHLDITDGELESLEAKINFILYGEAKKPMKTITLYNQVIQFDADDGISGTPKEQANIVLDKISNLLNTADIAGAQILFTGFDDGDIEVGDTSEEDGI